MTIASSGTTIGAARPRPPIRPYLDEIAAHLVNQVNSLEAFEGALDGMEGKEKAPQPSAVRLDVGGDPRNAPVGGRIEDKLDHIQSILRYIDTFHNRISARF